VLHCGHSRRIRFVHSRGTQINARKYPRNNATKKTPTAASGSDAKLQLAFDEWLGDEQVAMKQLAMNIWQ
jgi:hypothetical protein